MVNPLLTATFDLFLIGSALAIIAAIASERRFRGPHAVGTTRRVRTGATVVRARRVAAPMYRPTPQHRGRQLRRAA